MMETVKTINAAVRTVLLTGLVGIVGAGGYFGYSEYTKRDKLMKEQEVQIQLATEQMKKLNSELSDKNLLIEKLETAMHLLKTDQRLAQLKVISIQDATKRVKPSRRSSVEFVELSPQGDELSKPKPIELPGDLIYVDNWIVKFDDNYVEKGDVERGTSLCLFRRIFSEESLPTDGLDEVGMRPQAYAR